MTVREDVVECKNNSGYWLTQIETKLNSIKGMIPNEKKLIVQVVNQRCAQENNFQAILFSYKNSTDNKVLSKLAIIDGSDSQDSCPEQNNTIVQELSLEKLGLESIF